MPPFPATIEQPTREHVLVSVDPVRNAIGSMLLVSKEDDMPGASAWVAQTREKLTEEELFNHRLVILGFFFAIQPDHDRASFSEYLDDLEKSTPEALRDKLLNAYAEICINCENAEEIKKTPVNWEEVLTSADNYVNFLMERFGEDLVYPKIEKKAYEYVIDPPALKKLIVDHMRWFWDKYLAPEWTRMEPILQESAKAFQASNYNNMSQTEIASFITGQELDEAHWSAMLEESDRVVFIPNPHIGPYLTRLHFGDTMAVLFGARQPENATVRIPELDRADIVARMSALSDDTRLRILQMVTENGEMRSQDIMEEVGLSQPSVSRYLTQLTVTGYLQERRVNGAKAYSLNRDRIEKTLKAVHKFLLGN